MRSDREKPIERLVRAAEPMLRRLLHFHWRFSRGLTLGVRAVVIDAGGKVFLVRHSYVAGWHLPGGGVEAGETLVEALARELAGEGRIVIVGAPPLPGGFYNPAGSPPDHGVGFAARGFRPGPA